MRTSIYLSPGMFGFAKVASYAYFEHIVTALERRFMHRGRSARVTICDVHPTASVRRRATKLCRAVHETAGEGRGPIHIVGHSTGGLDARLVASPSVHLPGITQAELAWLPRLEEVLARAPKPDEALMFARASGTAGQQVRELGRIKDAARYFSQAVINDPTYPNLEYYRSVAQAASGQFGAKDSLDRLVETRAVGYSWEIALTAAIFLNATDPEIVFAAAPADVKDVIPCYRDLIASLKATDKQARLAGAKRADVCLTAFDSPHVNIQAQSMLGDLDRAFEIFDRPDFTVFMWNYWSPIFLPSTKAMRADPRFLTVAQKLGFVDYWKQTKTQPDVCETAEERDFPVCVALREGG